jgi:hypothetical protein
MKTNLVFAAGSLAAAIFLSGCGTPIPPGAERGPHNTMAYDVLVEASEPGARIDANGEYIGNTPVHLKIFGDPDGTFHDFGSYFYAVQAAPLTTNQFARARYFRTGHLLTPEDRIPRRIFFDMNQPPAGPPMAGPPGYYGPPYYYGAPYPYYYGPPYFYGPGVGFYFGPGYYRRRW